MLTIDPCTTEEAAVIVDLWNAKRLDNESCWRQADPIDATYVQQLLALGMTIVIARDEETPVGFGLWCASGQEAWLVSLAANTPQVYYRLMSAFTEWGLASGRTQGFAELGAVSTTERTRMDALEVISYSTIGYEPLEPGQSPEERAPRLLRAECDLLVLEAALNAMLETLP